MLMHKTPRLQKEKTTAFQDQTPSARDGVQITAAPGLKSSINKRIQSPIMLVPQLRELLPPVDNSQVDHIAVPGSAPEQWKEFNFQSLQFWHASVFTLLEIKSAPIGDSECLKWNMKINL